MSSSAVDAGAPTDGGDRAAKGRAGSGAVSRCHHRRPSRPLPVSARALLGAALAAGVLILAGTGSAVDAQQRYQVHAWVQWISGSRMQVTTDAGLSLTVDLSQVDQRAYQGFRSGDGVTILGVVTPDRSRLVAQGIRADASLRSPAEAP